MFYLSAEDRDTIILMFSKRKSGLFVVAHVGSATIGAGYVNISPDGAIELVDVERMDFRIQGDNWLGELKTSLESIFTSLQKRVGKAPSGVAVYLSSHYLRHDIKHLITNFETPRKFDSRYLSSAIAEVKPEPSQDEKLVEERVWQIKINGYPTENPTGKLGKRFEINLARSYASNSILDVINNCVLSAFHVKDPLIGSIHFALADLSKNVNQGRDDFLIIDIGGESSCISSIENGTLDKTWSIPMGRRSVPDSIAPVAGDRDLAVSTIDASRLGVLDERQSILVEEVGGKLEAKWVESNQIAIKPYLRDMLCFGKAYMIVKDDARELFGELSGKALSGICPRFKEELVTVNGAYLRNWMNVKNGVTADPFIMTPAIYYARLMQTSN